MYHRFVRSASSLFTSQTPLPYVQINEIALPVDGSLPDGMDSIDTRTQLQSSACVASQIEDKQNGGGTRRMQRRYYKQNFDLQSTYVLYVFVGL
ncbi:unnamed protein product [Toxocara canis]|uniref:Uncharacterized protein n=1 Tax=Toxocara canis TaxID=6265 RepID=A0A183U9Z1_TOXCA|nr:unnamed protein product [Toxocara canis]